MTSPTPRKSAGWAKMPLVKPRVACEKAAMTQTADITVETALGTVPANSASFPLVHLISGT